jgi:hypothetical protein
MAQIAFHGASESPFWFLERLLCVQSCEFSLSRLRYRHRPDVTTVLVTGAMALRDPLQQ